MRTAGIAFVALWLTGCATAPVPDLSAASLPERYSWDESWAPAQPADSLPKGPWWERFADPSLNDLQRVAVRNSPAVKIALAHLDAARADAQAAAGALWPKIGITATHVRSRTSQEGPTYSPSRPNPGDDYNASVSLSYEIDLFGRIRSGAGAAAALAASAQADALAVDLAIRAEVTVTYFQLRSIDSQLDVVRESVAAQEKALQVLERQQSAGSATLGDVATARTQLESVRTLLADTQLRRSQTEHALAVLLGETPSNFHRPAAPLDRTMALPRVFPGLPSALLQRRPDIASAQRRVESASAAVGLARRAFFPVFSVGAALGRDSTRADHWFEAPARFWSLAPAAAATLLDGGQRRALVRRAVANLEESTESYRRTVLTANQEVEDQMAAVQLLEVAADSAAKSADAAWVSRTQALRRLDAGAATALEVASAQNAVLTARLNEIGITQRRISATVLLVRAVGGYWE